MVTLANALDQEIFDVTVVSFYSGQPLEAELAAGSVRFTSLNKRGRWDLLPFYYRLVREVRRLRPEVLYSWLDIPNLLALSLKLFVRARVVWGLGTSLINLRHYDYMFWLAAGLERVLSRCPDLIIINSNAGFEQHVTRGFPRSKLIVIPNGFDTEVFKPDREAGLRLRAEWDIAANSKLIGVVGRLDPMKDYPNFLRAAAQLARRFLDVRFACVGTGPESYARELRRLANDLGIANQIVWTGACADMCAVYNALDVLVSSSCSEGLPNAIGEAMACGVPCVVTDVGDSALLLGDCGTVVPPQDPEALADGITRCLAAKREDFGARARKRIAENFGVQYFAECSAKAVASLTERRLGK